MPLPVPLLRQELPFSCIAAAARMVLSTFEPQGTRFAWQVGGAVPALPSG